MDLTDKFVHSPCIGACIIDYNNMCIGCHRHKEEIYYWSEFNNAERREIVMRIRDDRDLGHIWNDSEVQ